MGIRVEKIKKERREIEITGVGLLPLDVAATLPNEIRQYKGAWWLEDKVQYPFASDFPKVMVVNSDGYIDPNGRDVDTVNVFLRPVLYIKNLELADFEVGDTFLFSEREFKIINNQMAFCLSDLGLRIFDDSSDDYDVSCIKSVLEQWFSNQSYDFQDGASLYEKIMASKNRTEMLSQQIYDECVRAFEEFGEYNLDDCSKSGLKVEVVKLSDMAGAPWDARYFISSIQYEEVTNTLESYANSAPELKSAIEMMILNGVSHPKSSIRKQVRLNSKTIAALEKTYEKVFGGSLERI